MVAWICDNSNSESPKLQLWLKKESEVSTAALRPAAFPGAQQPDRPCSIDKMETVIRAARISWV